MPNNAPAVQLLKGHYPEAYRTENNDKTMEYGMARQVNEQELVLVVRTVALSLF